MRLDRLVGSGNIESVGEIQLEIGCTRVGWWQRFLLVSRWSSENRVFILPEL